MSKPSSNTSPSERNCTCQRPTIEASPATVLSEDCFPAFCAWKTGDLGKRANVPKDETLHEALALPANIVQPAKRANARNALKTNVGRGRIVITPSLARPCPRLPNAVAARSQTLLQTL